MARPVNSFSLFFDNEETEDPTEIAAQLKKKAEQLEKKAEQLKKKAEEEAMMVEALIMDKEWKRLKAEKLARQQKQLEEEEKVERDSQGSSKPNGQHNKNVVYIKKGQSMASNGNGSTQGQSRPSSAHSQQAQTPVLDKTNNGTVVESAKLSNDVANGATEKKAETKEERKARLEAERRAKEKQAEWERKRIEDEIEAKQMTLEKYEKSVLLAKRKALEDKTKKVEERKVILDQEFENMHLIGKKGEEILSIKQEAEREKISKLKKKGDKAKTINISDFQNLYGAKTSQGASNGRLGGVVHGLGRGAVNANLRNGVKPRQDGAYIKPIASGNNGNYQSGRGYQKEAPRKDGAYKKPIGNGNNNGNNRNGQSGYQRATTNEPSTKKLPAKSMAPPSFEDTEQFPGLLKH